MTWKKKSRHLCVRDSNICFVLNYRLTHLEKVLKEKTEHWHRWPEREEQGSIIRFRTSFTLVRTPVPSQEQSKHCPTFPWDWNVWEDISIPERWPDFKAAHEWIWILVLFLFHSPSAWWLCRRRSLCEQRSQTQNTDGQKKRESWTNN